MTAAIVWISSWEMECCGEPFAVGDIVSLHLDDKPDARWYESALGSDVAQRITHAEGHHEEEYPEYSGRVLGIERAWCAYGPSGTDDRDHYPIPGTARFETVERIDGPERQADPDVIFNGWVVELDLAGTTPRIRH